MADTFTLGLLDEKNINSSSTAGPDKPLTAPALPVSGAAPTNFTQSASQVFSSSASSSLSAVSSIVSSDLFGDIDEVTTTSDYYNLDTPYTGYVWITFPQATVAGPDASGNVLGGISTSANALSTVSDLISVRPQQLREFSISRLINGIGQFKLTLFDPNYTEIESKLVKNKGTIAFKYGYSDKYSSAGTGPGVSPLYTGKVLSYSIEFFLEGAEISMNGLSAGHELNLIRTFKAHNNFEGKRISDIVTDMATDAGLIPIVETTARLLTRAESDNVDKIDKVFLQTGETSLQFIINKLLPYAVNNSGDANYGVFVKLNKGKTELHFHTPYYKPSDSSTTTSSSTSTAVGTAKASVSTEIVPTFTMFKDKDSVLKSFRPDWKMSTYQIIGGGSTFSAAVNSTSKDIRMILVDNNAAVPQTVDGKDNKGINETPKLKGKQISTYNAMVMPGPSKEEQDARVLAALSTRHIGAISATAEILGNASSFNIFDKVAVVIYIPKGSDVASLGSQNVHWVSGYYRISGITDIIRGGDFITHLSLITDGRSNFLQDNKIVKKAP